MVKSRSRRAKRVASLALVTRTRTRTRSTRTESCEPLQKRVLRNPQSDLVTVRVRAGLHSATLSLASPSPPLSGSLSHRLQSTMVSHPLRRQPCKLRLTRLSRQSREVTAPSSLTDSRVSRKRQVRTLSTWHGMVAVQTTLRLTCLLPCAPCRRSSREPTSSSRGSSDPSSWRLASSPG